MSFFAKMNQHHRLLTRSDSLIGRSAEESILLNSYFASLSMGQNSPAAVILIHGDSGLGKTKLAETLRPHVVEDDGYFIQGKFDQLSYGSANKPYSGISCAFAEYCSAVESRDQDTLHEVSFKLRQVICEKDEGKLLLEAIPSLRKIIGDASSASTEEEESKMSEEMFLDGFESRSHRLNYLIKRVVSVISSIGDPIVCLIDDIQWANKTEIDVLKALMAGAANPFTFIFTCRPGNHPFLQITDEYGGKTEIVLQSLKRNSVRELVAEILNMAPDPSLDSLVDFISRVTDGNPFFIRQHVISLRDQGLLRYGNDGWVWNTDELEGIHDNVLDNVVVMLSEKMKRLPRLTQEVLKICSCLGAKVDLYLVGLLIREILQYNDVPDTDDDNVAFAKTAISRAAEEGFLAVSSTGDKVSFTHDSVNEAAYFLLEPEEQAPYHLQLGQILHRNVCPTLLRKYLYTIAAQLARGNELISDEEDRIATATIFLSAGEKSMSASAFPEAHFFFSKGIELLREDDWVQNYRLCCDIYMKDADTAAVTGDTRDMDRRLAVLFLKCKGSIVDYLNAQCINVRSLSSRDDPTALDVGINALKIAGETFPDSRLRMHIIIGLARIRRSMKGKRLCDILQLPTIEDEKTIATLRLLLLLVRATVPRNPELLPIIVLRVLQLNLTYGCSKTMPAALALYGAILSYLGFSLKESTRYGDMAISLQDKLKCRDNLPLVACATYGSSFTRTKRLAECIEPLKSGFEAAIMARDTPHAISCANGLGMVSFYSGQSLKKLSKTLEKTKTSLVEYNMTRGLRMNRMYRNTVDHCIGASRESRFKLPFDSSFAGCYKTRAKADLILNEYSKLLQLAVACIFCDDEYAWIMAGEVNRFESIFRGVVWPFTCNFYRGMAAMTMLRTSKSKQFVKAAKFCLKHLRKGCKRCGTNLLHQLYLLEAEYAAFTKKHASAEKFYVLAIEHAAGVTHEHAYACERFGTYQLLRNNHDAAYELIREANRLYAKWGSKPKCEQLKKKYPRLDEQQEQLFAPITI